MPEVAAAPSLIPDTRPLPEIMAFLNRAQLTGSLEVISETASRTLIFQNGEVKAVRSSADEEKLGSWLVGTGVISENLMAIGMLTQLKSTRAPLGELLVKGGHVSRRVVNHSLEELAIAIVERATADKRRDIVYSEQVTAGPETLMLISTRQLILISARMIGSQKAKRRYLGSLQRPVRLSATAKEIELTLDLTDGERILLNQIEANYFATLADIQASLGLSDAELLSVAYGPVVCGLVQFHRQDDVLTASTSVERGRADQLRPPSRSEEVQANLERAGTLVEIGNASGAIRMLEDLFDEQQQSEYLVLAARIMVQEGMQGGQILSTLRKALEYDPGLVNGWLELAGFWRRRGNRERERRALGKVLDLDPDNVPALARYRTLGG